jgi:hypothetical protein
VALPLVTAELNDFDEADWNDLRGRGLQIIDLKAAQVHRAIVLKSEFAGLSVYDCFSWLWCKPSESMKRTLGIIARLRRRELHSRLLAPYCL